MLAIGRALVARPKLAAEVFGIIRRINQKLGVTILLVEQNARMALSSPVWVM